MKSFIHSLTSFILFTFFLPCAHAQHLSWNSENQTKATCLYGEVTVLATHPAIYYCGANWHPGSPAGGYCGIQDVSLKERLAIFSIWDTSPSLHPKTTEADSKTNFGRFGGEGEGQQTLLHWDWKPRDTFQFFVQKKPGANDTTDTRYYIYDRKKNQWLHSATINNPNGGQESVSTIAGDLNSFLENFGGEDIEVPRLALYRLWLGSSIDTMKCLTAAEGDGMWGKLNDAYFLAAGDRAKLNTVLTKLESKYGKASFAENGEKPSPISDKVIPADVVTALRNPPQAATVKDESAGKPSP